MSVVGTNDLHGHIELLPLLGGYLENLRRARRATGGDVLLVDGGDMFQGTLESNLGEGAAVVRAYNALGYAAAAVGNHEFDYGPVGSAVTPQSPADDPLGALKARAGEAHFPLLVANIAQRKTKERVAWPGMPASTTVEVAGVRIGLVGVTSTGTFGATIAPNVAGLEIAPLVPTVAAEAARLRAAGAVAVVVLAHAGGECRKLDQPEDPSACGKGEALDLARALPPGAVDVIVAAHTHKAIAHRVAGIAVIESYADGQAFGRVDLTIDRRARRVAELRIHPPHKLCRKTARTIAACAPGDYEGAAVTASEPVLAAIREDLARAAGVRDRSLGVRIETPVATSYKSESALGNLVADLMREARPGVDVAITNAGGVRADLPVGELTYGTFYETIPFDNRFARGRLRAEHVRRLLAGSLRGSGGILLVSGLRAQARCAGTKIELELYDAAGRPVADDRELEVLTSDYLATGTAFRRAGIAPGVMQIEDGPPLREELVKILERRAGALRGDDPWLFDPARPRLAYPGSRPVRCR
ncbi:MAG: 5'-nucleotidase C-terminal domain-containing protein [Deltaproteobacteria bacterium]|nr:5'-nucleotidase C-terminal domain-containing protein [Deltaproteobacteria bacterium]